MEDYLRLIGLTLVLLGGDAGGAALPGAADVEKDPGHEHGSDDHDPGERDEGPAGQSGQAGGRGREEKREPAETRVEEINEFLQQLKAAQKEEISVSITYFVPDEKKAGGRYETVLGKVKKVEQEKEQLILQDGTKIDFDSIQSGFGL